MDNKKGKEMSKSKFAVYQIPEDNPKIRDMYFMNPLEIEAISDEYELVGLIEASDLEQAFTIGNIWAKNKIEVVGDMRSVSVGDIIENLETGVTHVVDNIGFVKINMKEVA